MLTCGFGGEFCFEINDVGQYLLAVLLNSFQSFEKLVERVLSIVLELGDLRVNWL